LGRIARIVQAMKEFSHPGTEEKTEADLNRAIETTIDVSRNEWKYSAELVTELDPELPRVAVLPGEFNQVMLNLIVNAAHAIAASAGEGGQKGEIRISTRRDEEWVEIRVRDSGTGMSEAIQKRIFEPFFTTKEVGKGSGQGLAIAWSVIVDKHQGTIEVDSAEGKGTTFVVRLPIKITEESQNREDDI
jgi:signal transduction histidine kinase